MKISRRFKRRKNPAAQVSTGSTLGAATIDVWLQRLANLTQVGLLALGVFGYFYTVLPVFENQQLQEQAARLELEKSAAQHQLDELLAEKQEVQVQISALRTSWQEEHIKSAQLAAEVKRARALELEARQKAADAAKTLATQAKLLDSARWDLVVFDLWTAHTASLFMTIEKGWHGDTQYGTNGAFIRAQATDWPQPYTQLLDTVEVVRDRRAKDGQIPARYYSELRSFIQARQAALQCSPPDFAALEGSYKLQFAAIEPSVEADVEASINKLVKQYEDKAQKVEITDDYRQSIRERVRHFKVVELDSSFISKLQDMRNACNNKVWPVIDELKESKGSHS